MKAFSLSLVFAAVLFMHSSSAQTPGSLDNTFDGDGKLTISIGTANAFGRSLAVQPDGKMVIAGYVSNGDHNDYGMIRLLPDGSPDNTFGDNGQVLTDFGIMNDYANAIAIQSTTGKILAGGHSFNGNGFDFSVACYLPDGKPDNSFGNDGKVITPMGVTSFGKSIAWQQDGKIVLGGYTFEENLNQFALVRYNTDGTLDNTFNGTGKVTVPFAANSAVVSAMVIQPAEGKIILAGQLFNEITFKWEFALARFNTDGTLDNSFDNDGQLTTAIGTTDNYINAITLQPDGKILVAGNSGTTPSNNNFSLARYNTDGSLDVAFGSGGIVISNIGTGNNQAQTVLVQPDGKIIAAGAVQIGAADNFAVARFTSAGLPDNTFGTGGKVTTQPGASDGIYAIALQPDGKLIAAGTSFTGSRFDFAVARYETGLITVVDEVDLRETSLSIYPNPAKQKAIINYELTSEKNISIQLRDINGRTIAQLAPSEIKSAGRQEQLINFPANLQTGFYFAALISGAEEQLIKVMIVE